MIIVLALVAGCFAALFAPTTNAATTPVPGNPAWDTKYVAAKVIPPALGPDSDLPDNPRTDASGDKIPANAHSADYPGIYFYWNDKQKDNGVLLVADWVFDLFVDGEFILTAKNANNYWGYKITPNAGQLIEGVYAYGIAKQIKYNEIGNNGKVSAKTDDLKNINMVFIDGKYKDAEFEIKKNWYDEEGTLVKDEAIITKLNKQLKFNNNYQLGKNIVKIIDFNTAVNGKKITVTETVPTEYIEKDGKNSQTITVKYNDKPTQTITFNNQKQNRPEPEIKLIKTIDGKILATWLTENPTHRLDELGMVFTLYEATFDDNNNIKRIVDGTPYYDDTTKVGPIILGADGVLDIVDTLTRFRDSSTFSGTYIVVESFVPGSIAESIFVGPAPPLVIFLSVDGRVARFDYGAFYTIVNGYGQGGYRISTLGYPKLNNAGDIFFIGVNNTETGQIYPSYCAHAGSEQFSGSGATACKGYMVAFSYKTPDAWIEDARAYADFIAALNYIEDTYGDLDKNRIITQTVIWALLGAIDVNSPLFEQTNLTSDEKVAVKATIEAANVGYSGKGKIVDVVYMVCENHGADHVGPDVFLYCQPQLVPIYNVMIDNKVKDNPTVDVAFTKTKCEDLWAVTAGEFEFKLYKIGNNKETYIGTYSNDANGVVTAKGLAPGDYVFREVMAKYTIPGIAEYALLWEAKYPGGADGLYFTITAAGKINWRDGESTVDNIFFDKNYVHWINGSPESYTGVGEVGDIFKDGFIFYPHGKDAAKSNPTMTYDAPTCTQGGMLWFFYGNNQPLTAVSVSKALGHGDWTLSTVGDSLVCGKCGHQISWWDMKDDLLAIYHGLGGTGGLKP
jgi:hypothetical protein